LAQQIQTRPNFVLKSSHNLLAPSLPPKHTCIQSHGAFTDTMQRFLNPSIHLSLSPGNECLSLPPKHTCIQNTVTDTKQRFLNPFVSFSRQRVSFSLSHSLCLSHSLSLSLSLFLCLSGSFFFLQRALLCDCLSIIYHLSYLPPTTLFLSLFVGLFVGDPVLPSPRKDECLRNDACLRTDALSLAVCLCI